MTIHEIYPVGVVTCGGAHNCYGALVEDAESVEYVYWTDGGAERLRPRAYKGKRWTISGVPLTMQSRSTRRADALLARHELAVSR